VVRTDRDLTAIGKIADLVPTSAVLALGDTGRIHNERFRVLGRVQLDHGRGPWDEWYVAFDDTRWGFLSQAQGRWYLTFERSADGLPTWDALEAGAQTRLPDTGETQWVVTERGGSALLSAEGELPFPAVPLSSGRYADLEAAGDAFATIDFNDGTAPPQLFVGRRYPADAVVVEGEARPRPSEHVPVEKLACPNCGGPVQIFVPESERIGCSSCGALLDHTTGMLALLQQLTPVTLQPFAPLGSQASLFGKRRMLIGMMQRSLRVEGEIFTWREYLLHANDGYSWLVEDNGHFMYLRPVSAGAVRKLDKHAEYAGRRYKHFSRADPSVDFVVGEFYWKVHAGDVSHTVDYVAPPRILSFEKSGDEINWSEGEYVPGEELAEAFRLKSALPRPEGVSPCQPNPHALRGPALVFCALAALMTLATLSFEVANDTRVLAEKNIALPPSETAIKAGMARPAPQFLGPFEITKGPTTIKLVLESTLESGYTALATSLLNETTGEVAEAEVLAEYYHGVTDGESWSEGSRDATEYYGKLGAGRYVLRIDASWDPWGVYLTSMPVARLRVVEGERSPGMCFGAWILLALPLLFRLLRRLAFEARRNENKSP
jgi:hypothetical protein